jgi:sugar lactone lactonase YvrE
MTAPKVRVALDEVFDLGEGPFWDPVRERLLWVDIRSGRVLVGRLEPTGRITPVDEVRFPGTVGAVAVSQAGDWVAAGTHGLLIRSADGLLAAGPRLLPPDCGRRLNDGKPDPAGRYVVGTVSLNGPSRTETLSVVDVDGTVTTLDDDLTLSNGLAWTAEGTVLYSVDTLDGVVYQRPYDPATGTAGARSVLLTISDGSPDGLCLDREGHLWIAIWGAGQVRRYAPDGRLVTTIEVPAPHTSCVAFAGPALETMVITTATQDMTDDQLAAYPLAGRVFTVEPGVPGLAQALWAGIDPSARTTKESTA